MQKRHLPCIRGEPWEKAKAACLCVSYTALSPDSPPPHKDYRPNESHKKESRGGGSKATKTKCLPLFSPCFPKLLSGDRVRSRKESFTAAAAIHGEKSSCSSMSSSRSLFYSLNLSLRQPVHNGHK